MDFCNIEAGNVVCEFYTIFYYSIEYYFIIVLSTIGFT